MLNGEGKRLGHKALARSLQPASSGAAPEWLARIVDHTTVFAAGTPFPDDIAAFAAVRE